MSKLTDILGLFKYDPETDGANTFNITQALNNNWDKIDQLCCWPSRRPQRTIRRAVTPWAPTARTAGSCISAAQRSRTARRGRQSTGRRRPSRRSWPRLGRLCQIRQIAGEFYLKVG